ncbi:FAD-binding-3 domain-containing protein [Fusarium falciforme]|uniref:FAD-binding-3 domain-containing protein n=1 Tax=Fusarium falciforme TaxID=195108 RepID=UPI002300FC12|nr:FAD-binding-3 domain-containing protein [Fusarium falciforme]WAO90079.1 FAD-binding-3 domain-containing protein [Fusarium falciforme]
MPSPTPGFNDVIIVGAGPSGLLLALMLAQSSIPVTLLDMKSDLDKNPRATHYPAPSMHELNRAGVGDDLRERGLMPAGVTWRKLDGTPIVTLDAGSVSHDPDRMVCLPLDQLGEILRKHLLKHQNVNILFNYKVYYDFDQFKWNDSNFIVHPEHYYMAAKITKDGMWRVSYGELPGLTFEQLRERQPAKFRDMLPGHPSPSDYKLVNFSPYKVHQRLVTSMRQGRFLLAADAAHLCNPFGGLGLTGGIVDVGGLYDCLRGIYEHKADTTILDKYNEIRRQKWLDVIDVVSSSNLRRLFELDPERALETDSFFQMLKKAETDPACSQELQNAVKAIQHDFTQYYK